MLSSLQLFFCYLLKIFYPWYDDEYYINTISNDLNEINQTVHLPLSGFLDVLHKVNPADDKVSIRVYYQCHCPCCIRFDTEIFAPVVREMHRYLDIKTYPYGNAKTIEHNGTYEIKCQNGPTECYGNKLHACALDLMKNKTEALLFNSCMMIPRKNNQSSDDEAADICAKEFKVNAETIKACAKSSKGGQLLKYYGDESKKVRYNHVPFILIDGKARKWSNLKRDICNAFLNPPPPCKDIESDEEKSFTCTN